MKWAIAFLVACLLVSAAQSGDDAQAELRKLEGAWHVVSFEWAGMKADPFKGGPEKAVIKGGKATFFTGGKEIPHLTDLKLILDPKKKPKAVDLVRGEKESLPCIYEVTADELKIAMPYVPKDRKPGENLPRPESFDTKDKPFMVLTAKRSKE